MAKIGPQTHSRRIWLQVVLCVILVLTIGLAALVSAALDRAAGVDLGPVQTIGTLRLRLPEGWIVESTTTPAGTLIGAQAPSDDPPNRAIQVHHLALPMPLDCQSLLESPVGMPRDYMVLGGEAQQVRKSAVEVVGQTGELREGVRVARSAPGEAIFHEVFICASLPTRQEGLLLQLRALRTPDDMLDRGDRLILRRVAESVELVSPPLNPPVE